MMTSQTLTTIGSNEAVDIIGHASGVPAKVDTGADTSSIWVSNISVDQEGVLSFTLFDKASPYYTGEQITSSAYKVTLVRSASGHEQVRYRTSFSLRVGGKRIRATFNLSDRSKNKFPILIGKRTLKGKFLVDVSKAHYEDQGRVFQDETAALNKILEQDPYAFFKEHYEQSGVGIRRTE